MESTQGSPSTYVAGHLGGHGNDYQRQLAWILLLRLMLKKGVEFLLAFEMVLAGKFDDICVFLEEGWILIQTKSSENMKTITEEELYDGSDGNLSLAKYYESYRDMKLDNVKNMILFTNRELDSKFDVNSYREAKVNPLFEFKKGKHFNLNNQVEKMVQALKNKAFLKDLPNISKALIALFNKNEMSEILKLYHFYLKKYNILNRIVDKVTIPDSNKYENDQIRNICSKLGLHNIKNKSIDASVMDNFWNLQDDLVQLKDDHESIRNFCSKLVLSVSQPNVEELKEEMIREGQLWMRERFYPDDLGRMDRKFFELPLAIIKEEFTNYEMLGEDARCNKKEKNFMEAPQVKDIQMKIIEKLQKDVEIASRRSCASLETMKNYYINRMLYCSMAENPIEDKDFVKKLDQIFNQNKCIILTAQPGMGKSTLWQYLAFEAQKIHEDKAVFLIYLNNLRGEIKEIKKLEDISRLNVFKNELSKENVELLTANSNTEIILFADAYDELSAENQKNAINLFNVLSAKPNIKIIISGRRHVKESLNQLPSATFIEVQPFNEDEQKQYLQQFWKENVKHDEQNSDQNAKFEPFAARVLEKFHSDISRKEYDFTGIPLMVRMMAEVYAGPFEKYLNSSVFLDQIIPQEKLGLVDLYEQFSRKCIQITMNKKLNRDNNSKFDSFFEPQMKSVDYDYQVLAVDLLRDDDYRKMLKPFITNKKFHKTLKSFKERIVNEQSLIVENVAGNPRYTHLSFGEYFAAKYLYDFCGRKEALLCKEEILKCLTHNNIVRIFFLAMIDSDIPKHSTEESFKNRLHLLKELGEMIIIWACESDFCNILEYLSKHFTLEDIRDYDTKKSLFQISVESDSKKCEQFLAENSKQQLKDLFLCALKSNRFHAVKNICNKMNINLDYKDSENQILFKDLFNSLSFEYDGANEIAQHIFYFFEDNKLFKQKESYNFKTLNLIKYKNERKETLLHLACKNGNLKLVELLTSNGAAVNARNKCRETSLDVAVRNCHLEIVKFLRDKFEAETTFFESKMAHLLKIETLSSFEREDFINCLDPKPEIPDTFLLKFHMNCNGISRLGVLTVKKNIKNAIEIGLLLKMDFNDSFALHYAVESGCLESVKKVCDKMKNINIQNKKGKTALHIAIENGSYEIVEFLVSKGSDFSSKDDDGNTVLHLAVEQRNQDIFEFIFGNFSHLLNDKNRKEKSALDLAIKSENDNYVRLLLKKDADLNEFYLNRIQFPCKWSVETSQLLLRNAEKLKLNNERLLHLAVGLGCVETVKKIIEGGVKVDTVLDRDRKQTALHIAVELGHFDVVKELIHLEANVNCRNYYEQTPLHLCRSKEIYQLLVSGKADETIKDKFGDTVLHEATENNCIEVVECFLNSNKTQDHIHIPNAEGETALHIAAFWGREEIVKLLVGNKAGINMKDNEQKTPMHYAIEKGNRKIFNLLKDASAEINLNDYKGMIHRAACDEDNVDYIKLLLEIGVDVNEADEVGKIALHHAAENDAGKIIFTLIKAGANVNAEDKDGNIPLHYAVLKSGLTIGYLIDFNSNIDHQNKKGETPLHSAILDRYGGSAVARLLIAKKASIHLADNEGNTPLHLAFISEKADLVPILLNLTRPQELNRQNNQGETPLHLALLNGDLDLVKQLLDKGADFKLQTKQNKTALDLAREKNYTDIVNYLVTKASE